MLLSILPRPINTNWSSEHCWSSSRALPAGHDHFFQNSGNSSTNADTISSRPIHMQKKSSILAAGSMSLKLDAGPTIPKPGPTLPRDVATEERIVSMVMRGSS